MPLLADDDVIVNGNAERLGNVGNRLGHLNVRGRRCRIAGGVIVHHPNGRCNQLILLVKSAPWMQVEPLIGGGPR